MNKFGIDALSKGFFEPFGFVFRRCFLSEFGI